MTDNVFETAITNNLAALAVELCLLSELETTGMNDAQKCAQFVRALDRELGFFRDNCVYSYGEACWRQ